jgi:A/G-specific adenine glycosylase
MDLGAMLCTARAPACERCPVRTWCAAAPAGRARIADAAKKRRSKSRGGPQARLPFEATRRFIRGRVLDRLRELEPGALLPAGEIESRYPVEEIVLGLERDGLVVREAGGIRLR